MAGRDRNRESDDPLFRCIKQTPCQDSYSYSDFLGKLHAQKEQYYETKWNSKGWGWVLGNGRETTGLRVELLIVNLHYLNRLSKDS